VAIQVRPLSLVATMGVLREKPDRIEFVRRMPMEL
jgi:hypothetical protein